MNTPAALLISLAALAAWSWPALQDPPPKQLDFESEVEDPVMGPGEKPYAPVTAAEQSWRQAPGFPKGVQHHNLVVHGQRRVELFRVPKGTLIPPHRYAGEVQLVVVSGTIEVGTGDKVDQSKADPLASGTTFRYPGEAAFWMIASKEDAVLVRETPHSSKLSYVRPEDDPRKAK